MNVLPRNSYSRIVVVQKKDKKLQKLVIELD